jgi:hypothetical protein
MNRFLIGIAPDHVPALVCLVLWPAGWVLLARLVRAHAAAGDGWALRLRRRWADTPELTRWAVWLLLAAAVVHLALPLGHADSPVLALAFLGSGAAFAWLAWRAVAGRRWRAGGAALLAATLVAYLVVVGRGEEPDQVGTTTVLLELTALGLCLVAPRAPHRTVHRMLVRPLASGALVLGTVLVGTVVWIEFAVGHDEHGSVGGNGSVGGHHHDSEYLARAQAGIVMRPAGPAPTLAQSRAAADLAARTAVEVARYRDHHAALAAGYRPTGKLAGLQVHFENKANQRDGRLVDPQAPEQLVYAVERGRILLLGVVYQMPTGGAEGPAVGGSQTRWHAHNVCITLLPPGFGVVSPFGSCPFTAFTVTIPEMMHVWIGDPPGGPYVDQPPDAWVRDRLASQGLPL